MENTNEEELKDYIRIKMIEKIISKKMNIGKNAEECIDIEKLNNAVEKIYEDCKGDKNKIYGMKNRQFYDYYLCKWIA